MGNMVDVRRYYYGLNSDSNNFDFEDKVKLGLESTPSDDLVAKIGLSFEQQLCFSYQGHTSIHPDG